MSNAKQLMERFRDRPVPPLQNAIWWIEFSLRRSKDTNKHGLASLRGPTSNLSWVQEAQLDVAAVLVILTAGVLAAVTSIVLKIHSAYKDFIHSKHPRRGSLIDPRRASILDPRRASIDPRRPSVNPRRGSLIGPLGGTLIQKKWN